MTTELISNGYPLRQFDDGVLRVRATALAARVRIDMVLLRATAREAFKAEPGERPAKHQGEHYLAEGNAYLTLWGLAQTSVKPLSDYAGCALPELVRAFVHARRNPRQPLTLVGGANYQRTAPTEEEMFKSGFVSEEGAILSTLAAASEGGLKISFSEALKRVREMYAEAQRVLGPRKN